MSAPTFAAPRADSAEAPPPAGVRSAGVALRHLAGAIAGNTLVAAMLTLLSPSLGRFGENLVYSLSIGLIAYGLVMLGRHKLWRGRDPSPSALIAVILGAMLAGFLGGSAIAAALLGHRWMLLGGKAQQAIVPALVTTIVATAIATLFVRDRVRLARLRLQAERARAQAARERAQAEAAQRAALDAQLRMLRAQLEPHMLFNTLANLRVLIGLDPARAQAMLDRLIGLLRATLAASRSDRVPLAAEFELLDDYLSLIGIRMGARLRYRLDLPPALRSLPVPPMLLQPLAENAVRHGLEPAVDGGTIEASASRDGSRLRLRIADNGVGFDADRASPGAPAPSAPAPSAAAPSAAAPSAAASSTHAPSTQAPGVPVPREPAGGFGLAQVRERLRTLYGDAASLRIESRRGDAGGGTMIEIELPIEEATP